MASGWLRRILVEDLGLKLLSLAFATLLWMFVVGEKRSEVSLSLPLELSRVPEDVMIVSPIPETVQVRLNGPRTLLAAANPQRLAVTLDLDGIRVGTSSMNILPSRLNLPRGIEVTSISPSVVTLEVDRKVHKVVPVRGRVRGVPAEGFEVAEVKAEPAEVELEGAERAMAKVREAVTEIVDVSGLDGRVTRPAELVLPDPTLRPLLRRPVQLDILVREMRAQREFVQVPVTVREEMVGPPAWRIDPGAVDIALEGALLAISRLKGGDVAARISVQEASAGATVEVQVEVPTGVNVLSVTPSEVRLVPTVRREPAEAAPTRDVSPNPQTGEQ